MAICSIPYQTQKLVTLTAMKISVHVLLASHQPDSKEHSLCWLWFARNGDSFFAVLNHQLVIDVST